MMKKLALALSLAALTASPVYAQNCTRDGLEGHVADYFTAVRTHDMSALHTAPNLRITENGQVIQPGQGFFQTGGKTAMQRTLIDTERCGTVTEAVADETVDGVTKPVVMAVRLKVDAGKVSEIETIFTREEEQARFYNPQGLLDTADQDWTTPLPRTARLTREYMNDGANKYFDGFAEDPAVEAPFAAECHRWEGGTHTTPTGNCSAKGLVITHTRRRFPVTDLELGITAGFINFGGALPDVHIFKYNAEGKIELINAVFGGRQPGEIWPPDKD